MKLYYAPNACSLSNRITLHEAALPFESERVDLHTGLTEAGDPFAAINPKGYVPMLVLDSGEAVTENIATLSLIADLAPHLLPEGPLGRVRMLEMLSYISSELHIAFKPFWHASTDDEKAQAAEKIGRLLDYVDARIEGDYLYGERFTPADAYLFVVLRWAKKFDLRIPDGLRAYFDRAGARYSVVLSLAEEGLA
jgi:glutathione S-transferase